MALATGGYPGVLAVFEKAVKGAWAMAKPAFSWADGRLGPRSAGNPFGPSWRFVPVGPNIGAAWQGETCQMGEAGICGPAKPLKAPQGFR